MSNNVYEQLADALDRLPNGFPRTPAGTEIAILKWIFSPEDAALGSQLSGSMEPVDTIAQRAGLPVEETMTRLMEMRKSALARSDEQDGKPRFRLAPFVVGFYEAQLHRMDHEFAHLSEKYMEDGGAAGIMGPEPAIHRVMPAHGAIKTEWILPYDDVRAILLDSKTFRVRDCICRVEQDYIGRRCDFPVKNCLSFSSLERPPGPGDISQEEALAILDETEEVGLVHTVNNVMKGVGYICNCCGCCCAILRGITDWGVENSVAQANYYAVIDPDECLGCGICIERCQVNAISEKDGVAVVDRKRCIGCGLCVTGCPGDVAELQRKPDDEIVHPPEDSSAWGHQRLVNRGLIE